MGTLDKRVMGVESEGEGEGGARRKSCCAMRTETETETKRGCAVQRASAIWGTAYSPAPVLDGEPVGEATRAQVLAGRRTAACVPKTGLETAGAAAESTLLRQA